MSGPIGPGSRLARDLNLGRQVALKLLPEDLTQDSSRVARFQQEARAASALNHPNVCTIYALGETPDGQQFIAMEFVEGETVAVEVDPSQVYVYRSPAPPRSLHEP